MIKGKTICMTDSESKLTINQPLYSRQ